MKVGDTVGYAGINLLDYRGVIVAIQRGTRGGDCLVDWQTPRRVEQAEECTLNLRKLTD
jgi:hypothetical protein